jgi:hypothetical protein
VVDEWDGKWGEYFQEKRAMKEMRRQERRRKSDEELMKQYETYEDDMTIKVES